MPLQIRCPSCDARLRVPETLLGKMVKCPKCQTAFSNELPPRSQSVQSQPSPKKESPRQRLVLPDEDAEDDESADEERPRLRKRPSQGGNSTLAQSALARPAIALMIFAGLGVFGHIVLLMQCVFTRDMPTGGFALLGILTCSAILNGAMKMKELRNYGFAMTACIMSMVPMLYCPCPLFFPFGIWGLLVLNKPDVKDAFR